MFIAKIVSAVCLAVLVALLGTPPAQASTAQQYDVSVEDRTVVDPCANTADVVVLSGSVHVVTNATVGSGGLVRLKVGFNAHNVHGTGQLSGDKFVGNGTGELSAKVKGPFPAKVTLPFHFFLLRQGKDGDLKVSALLHLLVHADGTVSGPKIELRQAECGKYKT